MKPEQLASLAESVADGVHIDWAAAEHAADHMQLPVVRHLRLVASIAAAHESQSAPDSVPSPAGAEGTPDRRTLGRWGQLDLLEVIGRGAHGVVYKAFDRQLQRTVALKQRPASHFQRDDSSIVSEARLLARVRHPAVVAVYGADVADGVLGIWMEHIEGQTLSDIIAQGGVFGADEAGVVGGSLCRALAAVHQAGLIHRDVKAANVMRERGGRIVLMDFGAGLEAEETAPTSGTPLYLAPENLAGARATVRSDIYALGVLLFHLVTGRYPVEARTIEELRARHAAGDVRRLRDLRPDLPEPFVRTVNRCLDAVPEHRFATAGELEQALSQPLASAAPVSIARRAALWALGLAATAAVILGQLHNTPVGPAPRSGAAGPSVAVMAFANATGDESLAYVARGFSDLLVTTLVRFNSLRVQSRPALSSGSAEGWKETAARLGADYVVTGSVVKAGTGLAAAIQLVEAATGRTIWALEDRLGPDELLRRPVVVAGLMASRLGAPPQPFAAQISPEIPAEAQEAYFRGLAEANSGVATRGSAALTHFREAVDRAPGFAEAWAALALQYIERGNAGPASDRGPNYAQARSAAAAALERNPRLGDAHTALGTIAFYFDWDWSAADVAFRQAAELGPGDAFVHQRYAMYLAARGRLDEAIDAARLSRAIEPMVPTRSSSLGTIYYYARRYDEAATEMQRALDLAPRFATAEYGLGRVRAAQGRYDEAAAHLTRAIELGNPVSGLLELARVHALQGRTTDAELALQKLGDLQPLVAVTPDNLAFVDAARGDPDTAFKRLDEALNVRAGNLLWAPVDPRFDPLRNDPRFESLLRRLQLPF